LPASKDGSPTGKRAATPHLASPRNPKVVQLRKWIARPERAHREDVIVAEGRHVAEEALDSALKPRLVISSPHLEDHPDGPNLLRRLEGKAETSLRVTAQLMEQISGDPSPQGIVTVWQRPARNTIPPGPDAQQERLLALVGVQDPGNVGSLLRTAAAFGISDVVILPGTADPYHPKVLRASAGTSFQLTYWEGAGDAPVPRVLKRLADRGWSLLALDPSGDKTLRPADATIATPWVLLLGSEGPGLPAEVLDLAHKRVRIPMEGSVDSLGVAVAGALGLYALIMGARGKKGSKGTKASKRSQETKGN
jgi:TrmH family RNA methyltransferase